MKRCRVQLHRALSLGVLSVLCIGMTVATHADTTESLPMEELKVFSEIFGKIKSDYVERVDDGELLKNAVRGMLNGLDPHSAYLEPEAYREVNILVTNPLQLLRKIICRSPIF